MDNTSVHVDQNNNIPCGRDKAILFILLDAYRWDYLNDQDSPTVASLRDQSIYAKKLMSSAGFTQRSTIFTGALPITHGNYTMYIFDPKTSPFKLLFPFRWFLRVMPKRGLLYRFVRKCINQLPKIFSDWAPPGRIPSDILPLISVTEDLQPVYKPGSLPVDSLFNKFKDAGIQYKYLMAPVSGHDEPTMNKALEAMTPDNQVMFVQFSDTDGLVHICGPESDKRRTIVKEADDRVKQLREKFEQVHDNPWIVIVGDHGMSHTHTYLDIWSQVENEAREHGLVNGKHYLMFLDSTLARFWFFSNKAKTVLRPRIEEMLQTGGEFIGDKYFKERQVERNDRWYGELIWKADQGYGIFPDFFHSEEDKYIGMHGYDSREDDMKGTAVFYNSQLSGTEELPEAGLEDITPTLCDILELPYPDDATGNSLVQR